MKFKELYKIEEPRQGGLVISGPFLSEFSTPFLPLFLAPFFSECCLTLNAVLA
jgi:hypothetical protein